MTKSVLAWIAAGGLAGAAGSAARADFMQYQGVGPLHVVAPTPTGVEFEFDTPVIGQLGGFGFTGFSGTAVQTFSVAPQDPDDVIGVGVLVGGTPADTLTVTFQGLAFGTNPGSAAVGASATFDGGTGVYAGMTGFGDLSAWVVFTSALGGDVGITLQAELVPTPAASGLLGLAFLIGGSRRRHRSRV
jgi:hypothetical protein